MHTIQQKSPLVARLFAAVVLPFRGMGPVRSLSSGVVRLMEVVLRWQDRANQRFVLRSMPDAALKDMGISRSDAEREAAKPFWLA